MLQAALAWQPWALIDIASPLTGWEPFEAGFDPATFLVQKGATA